MNETFKINKFRLTLGDDSEIVDCSNPALWDALKEQVTPDDDLYYIDNLNNQYWRFYTYGVYSRAEKTLIFADVFNADKFSDKERSLLVCSCEPFEFDFDTEEKKTPAAEYKRVNLTADMIENFTVYPPNVEDIYIRDGNEKVDFIVNAKRIVLKDDELEIALRSATDVKNFKRIIINGIKFVQEE